MSSSDPQGKIEQILIAHDYPCPLGDIAERSVPRKDECLLVTVEKLQCVYSNDSLVHIWSFYVYSATSLGCLALCLAKTISTNWC